MAITLGSLGALAVDLNANAHKFRQDLLRLPLIGCKTTFDHMTLRPGLRAAETVGELGGDTQFGPYSNSYKDANNITINPRTLQVFLGSVIKDFDPNEVAATIWGSKITKGEALKNTEIVAQIIPFIMGKIGKNLNAAIWSATRNASNHTTQDLFNGFDTITATEIGAGNIAAGNNNFQDLSSGITKGTSAGTVDVVKAFVQAAADELQGIEIEGGDAPKLYMPYWLYNQYNLDYQKTVGVQLYNKEYAKQMVEGTNVEMVPLVNKKNSNYIHLSTKNNMLIGVNQVGEEETIEVEKFSSFVLTLSATLFFGTQFESIAAERLCVGKIL